MTNIPPKNQINPPRSNFRQKIQTNKIYKVGQKALSTTSGRMIAEAAITTPATAVVAHMAGGGWEEWISAKIAVDKVAFWAKTALVGSSTIKNRPILKNGKKEKIYKTILKDKELTKKTFENWTNVSTLFNKIYFITGKKVFNSIKKGLKQTT